MASIDPNITPGNGGLPLLTVRHSSGSVLQVRITELSGRIIVVSLLQPCCQVYLHGATITSFKTPAGQELFYVSPNAIFDGAALRTLQSVARPS
jgi:D-hexose-6-phosphate mutarotase